MSFGFNFRRFAMAGLALVMAGVAVDFAGAAKARKPARPVYTCPCEAAKSDPDFLLQGEYVGDKVGVQVVAMGKGQFQVVTYKGGLPGAGWVGAAAKTAEAKAKTRTVAQCDAAAAKAAVKAMKRIERKSPTLGAKAPKGAVVLFDGTAETLKDHWEKGEMNDAKLLTQGAVSKDRFGDCTIHVEFRLPYKPQDRGQGRGNSGIYMQGRYEVQMLDSFGLEGRDNECGGIYKTGRPRENMCLPPLTWQTYDIQITSARFDADGKKTANAKVTVRHNGVLIHENLDCPKPTTSFMREFADESKPGPIYLQNHGNPVVYRNIWVVKN